MVDGLCGTQRSQNSLDILESSSVSGFLWRWNGSNSSTSLGSVPHTLWWPLVHPCPDQRLVPAGDQVDPHQITMWRNSTRASKQSRLWNHLNGDWLQRVHGNQRCWASNVKSLSSDIFVFSDRRLALVSTSFIQNDPDVEPHFSVSLQECKKTTTKRRWAEDQSEWAVLVTRLTRPQRL